MHSLAPGAAPTGVASFAVIKAEGYPPSSHVMVYIKQNGPKPKTVHKTAHIKSGTGTVTFDDKKESFKCSCSADTQFKIEVKGHNTFGSDDDLGEGLLVVDESGSGLEKSVKVGSGHVFVKSSFVLNSTENGGADSPRTPGGSLRKSFLGKREKDNGRNGRDITPTPPA